MILREPKKISNIASVYLDQPKQKGRMSKVQEASVLDSQLGFQIFGFFFVLVLVNWVFLYFGLNHHLST